jgi:hypothetical protein
MISLRMHVDADVESTSAVTDNNSATSPEPFQSGDVSWGGHVEVELISSFFKFRTVIVKSEVAVSSSVTHFDIHDGDSAKGRCADEQFTTWVFLLQDLTLGAEHFNLLVHPVKCNDDSPQLVCSGTNSVNVTESNKVSAGNLLVLGAEGSPIVAPAAAGIVRAKAQLLLSKSVRSKIAAREALTLAEAEVAVITAATQAAVTANISELKYSGSFSESSAFPELLKAIAAHHRRGINASNAPAPAVLAPAAVALAAETPAAVVLPTPAAAAAAAADAISLHGVPVLSSEDKKQYVKTCSRKFLAYLKAWARAQSEPGHKKVQLNRMIDVDVPRHTAMLQQGYCSMLRQLAEVNGGGPMSRADHAFCLEQQGYFENGASSTWLGKFQSISDVYYFRELCQSDRDLEVSKEQEVSVLAHITKNGLASSSVLVSSSPSTAFSRKVKIASEKGSAKKSKH